MKSPARSKREIPTSVKFDDPFAFPLPCNFFSHLCLERIVIVLPIGEGTTNVMEIDGDPH
jgi:hypothetical protein